MRIKIFLFSIAMIFATCLSSKLIAQTLTVCSLQNVPEGWVTIEETKCDCCGEAVGTRWTIKKIDKLPVLSQVMICSSSTMPTGWVVIDKTHCDCCGFLKSRYTIKKIDGMPSGSSVMTCEASYLPSGWVIVDVAKCNCCGASDQNSESTYKYTIKKL